MSEGAIGENQCESWQDLEPAMAEEMSQPSTENEGADRYSRDQPRQKVNQIPFEEPLPKKLGGSKSDEAGNQKSDSNERPSGRGSRNIAR